LAGDGTAATLNLAKIDDCCGHGLLLYMNVYLSLFKWYLFP